MRCTCCTMSTSTSTGPGHRTRRGQRRGQVDTREVPGRHLLDRCRPGQLRRRAGHHPWAAGCGRSLGSRSCTRTSRCATTSTSSRTCSSAERANRLGLDDVRMEILARETLDTLHVRTVTSVRQKVASLSGGQRQIGHRQGGAVGEQGVGARRAHRCSVPRGAPGAGPRRLADQGIGVVLISHNMNDVFEVADRIVTLFLGRVAAEVRGDTTHNQVVELITAGRPVMSASRPPSRADLRTPTWPRPTSPSPSPPPGTERPRREGGVLALRRTARLRPARAAEELAPCLRPASWCSSCSSASRQRRQLPVGTQLRQSPDAGGAHHAHRRRLVFVLLLGEIDLSAGATAGVCPCPWRGCRQRLLGVDLLPAAIVIGLAIGFLTGWLVEGWASVVRGNAGLLPVLAGRRPDHRQGGGTIAVTNDWIVAIANKNPRPRRAGSCGPSWWPGTG